MPENSSIRSLIDHTEEMITILEYLGETYAGEVELEKARPEPDAHYIALIQDIQTRIARLADLMEDDVIGQLIGLNNLIGSVEHLRRMRQGG
jgi:hypothetical protein